MEVKRSTVAVVRNNSGAFWFQTAILSYAEPNVNVKLNLPVLNQHLFGSTWNLSLSIWFGATLECLFESGVRVWFE